MLRLAMVNMSQDQKLLSACPKLQVVAYSMLFHYDIMIWKYYFTHTQDLLIGVHIKDWNMATCFIGCSPTCRRLHHSTCS